MAQTINKISASKVILALDTYNHTALNTGMYTTEVRLTEVPPSGISIAIKKNGSTQSTSIAPAAGQNHVDIVYTMSVTAADVIGVTLSSSTANDLEKNTIKGILSIRQGSV